MSRDPDEPTQPSSPPNHAPSEQWGPWQNRQEAQATSQTSEYSDPSTLTPASVSQSPSLPPLQAPQNTPSPRYHRGIAITALCGSILLILVSAFWLLAFQASLIDSSTSALLPASSWMGVLIFLALLAGSTFCGGAIILYHSIRFLVGNRSHRLTLPAFWIWLLVYLAVLVSGYGAYSSELDVVAPALSVILPLLAGILPVIALLAATTQLLPIPAFTPTWRRLSTALVCGAIVTFQIAGLLIILLNDPFERILHACVSPLCAGSPGGYSGFIFLAIVIPLVEELVKSLPFLLFLRQVRHHTEALLLGMLGGAGYGCIEGLIFILLFPNDWPFIAAISATFALLHSLTTGWIVLGWYHLSAKSSGRSLKAPGYWLAALLLHIIFNGSFAIFLLPGLPGEILKFGLEIGGLNLDAVASSFTGDFLLLGLALLFTFWRAGALRTRQPTIKISLKPDNSTRT
jgi:RsiW-degrading membrane proteinase PrsW (M82 family)